MKNNDLKHISDVSRWLLGFLFIYHGLVPKILWLSELEILLVEVNGLGIPAHIFSPIVGVAEILFGIAIIVFKQSKILVYLASLALVILMLYVGFVAPNYLAEAFNPVTTNLLGLGFCYLILFVDKHQAEQAELTQ